MSYFRYGESTGPGAVVGIKSLWCQHPLAPADVCKVYPEVAPGANPGLTPLSPPGLLHRPLIKAQHLWLAQALAAYQAMLSSCFDHSFCFCWEICALPQFVVLQVIEVRLRYVVGLDM